MPFTPDAPRESWLTREEAAAEARLSVRTIDRARRSGKLRYSKNGGWVRIRRDWFEAYLNGNQLLVLTAIAMLMMLMSLALACTCGEHLAEFCHLMRDWGFRPERQG